MPSTNKQIQSFKNAFLQCLWNFFCMFDHNLLHCQFEPIEKRLSTIMVVASLFGVINYSLITQSKIGTYMSKEWYNQSIHFYAYSTNPYLPTHLKQKSTTFIHIDNYEDLLLTNQNWLYQLVHHVTEQSVYAQSIFIGLIMYIAVIYWGLSTVSVKSTYLTIWYRFVALPVYLGTVTFVIAVYVLVQVYIDYVYCYLDGESAILAETLYHIITKVVIAMFALNLTATLFSNRCSIYDPFR